MNREALKVAPICTGDFVMPFGKYAGKTLYDIAEHDGQYVLWLHRKGILRIDKEFLNDVETDERETLDILYQCMHEIHND